MGEAALAEARERFSIARAAADALAVYEKVLALPRREGA
jgi:hypothetical protein